MSFGSWMNTVRTSRRLKLSDLAEPIGLTISTLSRIENGHISPSIDTMLRVARLFQVDRLEFYRAVTDKPDLKIPETSAPLGDVFTMNDVRQFEMFYQQHPVEAKSLLVNWFNLLYRATIIHGQSITGPIDLFCSEDIDKFYSSSDAFALEIRFPGQLSSQTIETIYAKGGVILPADVYLYLYALLLKSQIEYSHNITTFPLNVLNQLRQAGQARGLMLSYMIRLDQMLGGNGHIPVMCIMAVEYEEQFLGIPIRASPFVDSETTWQNLNHLRAGYLLLYMHRWFHVIPPPAPDWFLQLREQMVVVKTR